MFPYDLVSVSVIAILDPWRQQNGPFCTQDDSEDDSDDDPETNGAKLSPPTGEALSPELGDDGHDEAKTTGS